MKKGVSTMPNGVTVRVFTNDGVRFPAWRVGGLPGPNERNLVRVLPALPQL